MHVLDSSAFIHDYHTDEQMASIPDVREELEGESAFRFDAMEGSGMHIHIPTDGTVEKIERAAAETGDREELSTTDVRLLAAAFELDGVVVTDDYAVQNVADRPNNGSGGSSARAVAVSSTTTTTGVRSAGATSRGRTRPEGQGAVPTKTTTGLTTRAAPSRSHTAPQRGSRCSCRGRATGRRGCPSARTRIQE